jgi:putative phosphoesterase
MDNCKLLVLSDTHGHIAALKAVLSWANTQPVDSAVFLGDGISDLAPAADAAGFYRSWKLVRGNNDFEFSVPDSATLDFGGHRFFLCHGHRHGLHNGYYSLISSARNIQADAALFGHEHVPYCKNVNGIFLLNPGSIGRPRGRAGATFATIESMPGKKLKAEFWAIEKGGVIRECVI